MGTAAPAVAVAVPSALERFLASAGFDALGVLEASAYDALVPSAWRTDRLLDSARSVLVLASGGRAFWDAFQRAPEARLECDPVDAYTTRIAAECAAWPGLGGARAALAFERHEGVYADFVALGRAAGLGAPSRLGLLVSPRFGPWLSLRAVVLCERALVPTLALAGFAPCEGCPAPCAAACHGSAVELAGFDTRACGDARSREAACADRCDARRACVVGREHAYDPSAEAHHMRVSRALHVRTASVRDGAKAARG